MLVIKLYYNAIVGFLCALMTKIEVVQREIRYNIETKRNKPISKQTNRKNCRPYLEYDDYTCRPAIGRVTAR